MTFFELNQTDYGARAGTIFTQHGQVETPVFMPVATQGSVKALDSLDLRTLGAELLLSNTYHLYLRPGINVVKSMGGIQNFMAWDGPVLTDSGGYQGFSLQHLRKINEEGITFKSHLDGSWHLFTPEAAIRYQEELSADIVMPLDVCVPSGVERDLVTSASDRTARWAERSQEAHAGNSAALFGIVQGGLESDLREKSARQIVSIGFPGYAIGGLSVGETKKQMYSTISETIPMLPVDKPRYLMGVGSPEDLVEGVALGVDMFDCVLPTRVARSGSLFTREGRFNVTAAIYKNQESPVDKECDCKTCQTFSIAYVHHLFRSKELLAYRLATVHNLRFITRLMSEIRLAILSGRFKNFRTEFLRRYSPIDESLRIKQNRRRIEIIGKGRVN